MSPGRAAPWLGLGIGGVVLGIILDALLPLDPWFLRVQAGPGALLALGSGALTVIGLGVWFVARRLARARSATVSALAHGVQWEERARSEQQAHARFMRELDHELKNPLQAIKAAFAQVEQSDGSGPSLQTAQRQVDRLRLLSGRLRQVANEELYRGQRTRDVEGTGLGLALASRVVAAHGGTLDLRSRPGAGTVATLRLPLGPI